MCGGVSFLREGSSSFAFVSYVASVRYKGYRTISKCITLQSLWSYSITLAG